MAREAGLLTWLNPPEDVIERFKAFEALVRADEREQAEERVTDLFADMETPYLPDIIAAIRARGNT